jgi:hypothetical protein
VADPIGQPMENVRHIRDDVAARLKALCHEIDITRLRAPKVSLKARGAC